MRWYLAKLVFRVICANGNHKPQFEEQLRLIEATDDLHAFFKARSMGDSENMSQQLLPVKWEFIDVSELHSLTEASDGAEMHAVVNEVENDGKYITGIRQRANRLLQHGLIHFTELN